MMVSTVARATPDSVSVAYPQPTIIADNLAGNRPDCRQPIHGALPNVVEQVAPASVVAALTSQPTHLPGAEERSPWRNHPKLPRHKHRDR